MLVNLDNSKSENFKKSEHILNLLMREMESSVLLRGRKKQSLVGDIQIDIIVCNLCGTFISSIVIVTSFSEY